MDELIIPELMKIFILIMFIVSILALIVSAIAYNIKERKQIKKATQTERKVTKDESKRLSITDREA